MTPIIYIAVVIAQTDGNPPDMYLIPEDLLDNHTLEAMAEQVNDFPSWCTEGDDGEERVFFNLKEKAIAWGSAATNANPDMSERYPHSKPSEPFRIRRWYSYVVW